MPQPKVRDAEKTPPDDRAAPSVSRGSGAPAGRDYNALRREELINLLEQRDAEEAGGIHLTYAGQRPPWQIVRRVQPRRQRIERKLSCGSEEAQVANLIVEGENLQAMVSLYKYRGQVDLVIADPPYNTGQDFRYNDRWDEDPNDPDLGRLVPEDDGSRHSKWLRFMTPRLWMMKEMLKPGGVLAICIDHRELFRLGILLDQIFDEENRLAIINWQKTTVKNDKKHVASTTEYVLVYAKRAEQAETALLQRSEKALRRFGNPDNDEDEWKQGDPCAKGDKTHPTMVYAIQSPFTGELHYPPAGRHWTNEKRRMKEWLEAWGASYVERDLADGKAKGLIIKDAAVPGELGYSAAAPALKKAKQAAEAVLAKGPWPALYFGQTGLTKPMLKIFKSKVKAGSVPTTFWVDQEDDQIDLGTVSWDSSESGRSREGVEELDAMVGRGHGFATVKPLKLFRKLIQIWCPLGGIVLDPFAGSGTTGQAVLELNDQQDEEAQRRFILIEQGRPEAGDKYARTLTQVRVARALSGERIDREGKVSKAASPLAGGFRYVNLLNAIDGDAVLALEREEMLDLLLTTHWDQSERAGVHLRRLPAGKHTFLFGVNAKNEGYFLIWNGPNKPSVMDREAFKGIAAEAQTAKLRAPFHVYARIATYAGPNINFYQIPNRILEKLGFNEALDEFSNSAKESE